MRARFVIGSVVVLLAWLPLPSNGSPLTLPAAPVGTDCVREYVEAVGMACRTADGLLQVRLADGRVVTTHGPDPRPSHGAGELLSYPERAPACASSNDYAQHILYARPANRPSNYAAAAPQIRTIVKHMNGALNQESVHSGGPTADYKVRCDGAGAISVGSFVVQNSSNDFEQIANAAAAAGFNNGKTDYSIFYDASHPAYCGVAEFYYDDRPGAANANNNGGAYAVTYQGCWTDRTPMHENAHNQGAVQRLAPFSDLNAHCLEGRDVMCYTSDFVLLCIDRMHFDCNHDTYFDSAPEAGEWLATHWNIGSSVNRFIDFG